MQRLLVFLLIVYLTAVVFAPPIAGNELLRIDDLILVIAVVIAVLSRLESKKALSPGLVFTIAALIYLLVLIMLFSALIGGFHGQYNDSGLFKEFLRLGKYVLLVFLALSIEGNKRRDIVTYWILGLGIVVVITQIGQFAGGIGFNQSFSQFYGGAHHYDNAVSIRTRGLGAFYAGGPFANPNVASSFLIIPLILSLFFAVRGSAEAHGKKEHTRRRQIVLVTITIFLFIGIILTDSRAAIVTLSLVLAFVFLVNKGGKARSLMIAIVPLTILLLLSPIITNRVIIFDQVSEGLKEGGSLAVKMTSFSNGIHQLFDSGYWWGFGAGGGPQVDFEMAYFLIWYGIPGLVVYFLFWFGMMWGVVKHKDMIRNWPAILAIVIASFLLNFSQSTFLNIRVFPIFLIVLLMNITGGPLETDERTSRASTTEQSINIAPQ